MSNNIKIVIGSWGSYNECNERALGSKWLDLSDYSDWDEIVEELKNEGFELDGIDEELFIQDVEGIEDRSVNWDYVNPETLFNTLKESGVLTEPTEITENGSVTKAVFAANPLGESPLFFVYGIFRFLSVF